ncbi:uncharacterized protein LOC111087393 isoform X2 [Limulus polyphemus]|uniref:Uncharacterized protein LOC111087393 isoform X2 n=1 Tax=Limulus polyphemus TaxID=6850 RepID=A0ABM1T129_LIMPO|nr:uncharacterized protein LOC111087393 isoform X2 [Limulus polyphemus]
MLKVMLSVVNVLTLLYYPQMTVRLNGRASFRNSYSGETKQTSTKDNVVTTLKTAHFIKDTGDNSEYTTSQENQKRGQMYVEGKPQLLLQQKINRRRLSIIQSNKPWLNQSDLEKKCNCSSHGSYYMNINVFKGNFVKSLLDNKNNRKLQVNHAKSIGNVHVNNSLTMSRRKGIKQNYKLKELSQTWKKLKLFKTHYLNKGFSLFAKKTIHKKDIAFNKINYWKPLIGKKYKVELLQSSYRNSNQFDPYTLLDIKAKFVNTTLKGGRKEENVTYMLRKEKSFHLTYPFQDKTFILRNNKHGTEVNQRILLKTNSSKVNESSVDFKIEVQTSKPEHGNINAKLFLLSMLFRKTPKRSNPEKLHVQSNSHLQLYRKSKFPYHYSLQSAKRNRRSVSTNKGIAAQPSEEIIIAASRQNKNFEDSHMVDTDTFKASEKEVLKAMAPIVVLDSDMNPTLHKSIQVLPPVNVEEQ